MSIWSHNGSQWDRVPFQHAPNFVPGILACPGPSLRALGDKLSGPGRFVLAVNTAYPTVPRPDAWVGMDKPEQFRPSLTREQFPKYWRANHHKLLDRSGAPLFGTPNSYFVDLAEAPYPDAIFQWRDNKTPCVWYRLTFQVGVHLLLKRGHRQLYFAGCDFSSGYCHEDLELEEWQNKRNRISYDGGLAWLRQFARRGAELGIECYSLTPDSPINAFMEFVEFDDFERGLEVPKETSVSYVEAKKP